MAQQDLVKSPKDPLVWLHSMRSLASADRDEAFQAGDNVLANKHYDMTLRFAEAANELEKLRKQDAVMTVVLKNRLEIALVAAEDSAWMPTHRHYKGTLYRVTGTKRRSAEGDEPIDGVDYDDAEGNRWWMPMHRWMSVTGTGKPRYAALLPDDEAFVLYSGGKPA